MSLFRQRILILLPFFLFLSACDKDEKEDPKEEEENMVDSGGAGDGAEAYLRKESFRKLIVEVNYMSGYKPTQRALDSLKGFLSQRLHKPDGIAFSTNEIQQVGKSEYSINDIEHLEKEHRTEFAGGNEVAAHFLFLDGGYVEDGSNAKTLGVAYGASSMAIFEDNVQEYSNEVTEPDRWKLEATVMDHEFGHILGLVDNGTPMRSDHKDDGHGAHCDDNNCLMYYATETSDVVSNLVGNQVPDLDQNCREDLKANGGK